MLWVLLALISFFMFAVSNIIDKILITKFLRSSLALTASFGLFGIVFSIILFISVGIPSIPFVYLIAALLSGFFLVSSIIFYVKSMSMEEASRVIPLWHLTALFTLILAVIFLDEVLTPLKYAAFASILVGGFIISAKHVRKTFRLSPALAFMLLSSFLLAISDILLKFAHNAGMLWQIFFAFYLGANLSQLSLFILPSIRKNALKAFSKHRHNFVVILFLSAAFGFFAQLLLNNAILLGPITLIASFVSFQSLFVLMLATFLSIKFPLLLKEAISFKTIRVKLAA